LKEATLSDIAREAKVSITTASFVLNGKGDNLKIKAETQKRILDIAQANNYTPNQLARNFRKGYTNTIGLIVPDISDDYYAKIAHRVEITAEKNNYKVIFGSSNENPVTENQLINTFISRQTDGLIIASTQKNKADLKKLESLGMPFVLIDRHYPDLPYNYVIHDNLGGIKTGVNELLKKKCKKIAFVNVNLDLEALIRRRKGYEEALEKAGMKVDPNLIKYVSFDKFKEELPGIIDSLLSIDTDGIIFSTHYLAIEGLKVCKKRKCGFEKPLIVSYGDHECFDMLERSVIRIDQSVTAIGDASIKMLVNAIKAKKEKKTFPREQIMLETKLVPVSKEE